LTRSTRRQLALAAGQRDADSVGWESRATVE